MDVMPLGEAFRTFKFYEAEILRLRLRMTLQHSLLCAEKSESDFMVGAFAFSIVSEEDFEIFVKH